MKNANDGNTTCGRATPSSSRRPGQLSPTLSVMATNPRDLTPDDINNLNPLGDEVPEYQTTEVFPRTGKNGTVEEVHIRANPAAQPAEPVQPAEPAPETVTFNRQSEYIPPADPAFAEPAYEVPVVQETTYVEPEPVVEQSTTVVEDARRGTIDFGLLLLRLALGALLIIQSVGTFFRLGGNEGIAGLESAFADYPYGNGLAIVVPTLELAAGVFLVLGLLTPVASLVAIAVTGFLALHAFNAQGDGFNVFAWGPETWMPVMLLGASLAMQFTGPGLYGVDAQRGWARRPLASSWICALVGLAAAGLMWWFGTEINPFA